LAASSRRSHAPTPREGACHYLQKPVDLDELDAVIDQILERRHVVAENQVLKGGVDESARWEGIVARDPVMERALNIVARAAPSQATVLISGESGTGKELVARGIHAASPRCELPFVAVNCAALNASLIESELFGHEKGAYTGADQQRQGRFEQADGGTLFIDEVGEMPAEVQVKLLRVLQERSFERVGGNHPIQVDVRLIAATNRDLEAMVRQGTFREDLFYRLNVVMAQLPPLRERRQDIPHLVDHFLVRYNAANAKSVQAFSREAMDLLMRYAYPGSVRELQNIVERAVVMARGEVISQEELPPGVQAGRDAALADEESGSLPARVEALERAAIEQAMEQTGGIQWRAAEQLGITERVLRYKLKKYGLK